MKNQHIIAYLVVVVAIVFLSYLYTSRVEAPTNQDILKEGPGTLEENDSATPSEEIKDSNLNGRYNWLGNKMSDGSVAYTPRSTTAFTIKFNDGEMTSSTDCNSLGGSYVSTEQTLSFGPLMSTLMYCEDSEEAVYSDFLSQATSYVKSNGYLFIKLNDGVVMTFAEAN